MKTCTNCGIEKSLSSYSKCATGKHGLRPTCKQCCSEASALRYMAKRDEIRGKNDTWRAANRGRVNAAAARRAREIRLSAIEVMGGACVACGSGELLVLDHVNGGGSEHRRTESNGRYYARIVRDGADDRFQVLCEACHAPKTSAEISASNSAHPRRGGS